MKKSIYILCGVVVLVVCAAYACEGCSEYMREKEREKEKIERYNALMERTNGILRIIRKTRNTCLMHIEFC